MGIHEGLGQDLWGFTRLWERIWETLGEDSGDFGRGFVGICETLGRIHGDSQEFVRLWEKIHKDL